MQRLLFAAIADWAKARGCRELASDALLDNAGFYGRRARVGELRTYFTRHGPIVGRQGDRWLSVSLMWQPVNALTQSYTRTKAQNLTEYLKVMELHTNSSNNTLFADAEGNIAYLHSNYIPRRDPALDWTQPVDGSDPATDWKGLHALGEIPRVVNPPNGWAMNTNNWPWSAAGPHSPVLSTCCRPARPRCGCVSGSPF